MYNKQHIIFSILVAGILVSSSAQAFKALPIEEYPQGYTRLGAYAPSPSGDYKNLRANRLIPDTLEIIDYIDFSTVYTPGDLSACKSPNQVHLDSIGQLSVCFDENGDGTVDYLLAAGGGPLNIDFSSKTVELNPLLVGQRYFMNLNFNDDADGTLESYVAFNGITNGFYITGTFDGWAASKTEISYAGAQMQYIPGGNILVIGDFTKGAPTDVNLKGATNLSIIGSDLNFDTAFSNVHTFGNIGALVGGDKNVIIGGENVITHSDGVTLLSTHGAGQVDLTGNGLALVSNANIDAFDIVMKDNIVLAPTEQVFISNKSTPASGQSNASLDVEGVITFGYQDTGGDARRMHANGTHGEALVHQAFRLRTNCTTPDPNLHATLSKMATGHCRVILHDAKYCISGAMVPVVTPINTTGADSPKMANVQYSLAGPGSQLDIRIWDVVGKIPADSELNVHTSCYFGYSPPVANRSREPVPTPQLVPYWETVAEVDL